jgi:hypothetical protein
MKNRKLLITLIVSLFAGVVVAQKKLGPEWKKLPDDPIGFGQQFGRTLETECTRNPDLNYTNYYLTMLEKNEVKAMETDDGRRVTLTMGSNLYRRGRDSSKQVEYAEIEVTKDEKGKVSKIRVKIGEMIHWDLNADGVFEGVYDGVAKQLRIVLDGKYVDVESALNGIEGGGARSPDHTIRYEFEGNKWKVKK